MGRLLSAEIPEKESDDDRVGSYHHQTTTQREENRTPAIGFPHQNSSYVSFF